MKKVKKAVVLAGGMGTRLLPITKSCPKEMLPIINKPVIHYVIEEIVNSGIKEILMITNSYKKTTEDYFDSHYELESKLKETKKFDQLSMIQDISKMANIYFVRQKEPLGTAQAVGLAKDFIGDEPFLLLFADNIIKSEINPLKKLIATYEKYNSNVIGVQDVSKEMISLYGIVEYLNDDLQIKRIVEKPEIGTMNSTSAALGRYLFKPEIFNEIETVKLKNGEYYLTEAILGLLKKQSCYGCNLDGVCYDLGSISGFLKANLSYAFDNPKLKTELLNYINKISK